MRKVLYLESQAEELFLDLFSDVFGPDKASLLYPQYGFVDIYNNTRFADFMMNNGSKKVAIEIDGEAVHNSKIVSFDKFDDDQLKQNSMISYGWDVYRWSYRKLMRMPDTVKEEMLLFLGDNPRLSEVKDYLPKQEAALIEGDFELREHQEKALGELSKIRKEGKTIALIAHATGTGKTVTAVLDAKSVGGRVLFIAHTKDLVMQPAETCEKLWKGKSIGLYVEGEKDKNADIVLGSVQSVSLNLDEFNPTEFDYIIIDEAHHASSESYQKIIAYFEPKFLLGLTATPERADNENILDTFQTVAHRVDIKTAVETGQLVPVRCIRIKTNIDISNVKYHGIKYNAVDLESKIFVPERNNLIVDTYIKYVQGKHTVIFCVSVKHAENIAELLREKGIKAEAVSGKMSTTDRKEILARYEKGDIEALCACDLLNEGWDSPKTDVLFMARPTMSKVLYTQQLGRGMRLCEGKDFLMVFDFVDNGNIYNAPYSLHRLIGKKEYRPGETVLGTLKGMQADEELYRRGEKPEALIDYPINALDFEIVDIFNWQQLAEGMISQMEFVRRVDVQSETIERYLREGKIKADLEIPTSSSRVFRYFKEESVENYAREFGWQLIDDNVKKDLFIKMIRDMDMSYSYKPVLIKAIFENIDTHGRVKLSDIVNYFKNYYNTRRAKGLIVENPRSLYCRDSYTDKEVERNILSNPFKRFEEMSMLRHTKTLGIIELDKAIFKKLTAEEIKQIISKCDEMLDKYYLRFK